MSWSTRHRDRVHAICHRYFRDPTDAEDATQETFLTVLRRAGTFRGEAQVSTWMYRVAVNTCHDMARHRARRPQTPWRTSAWSATSRARPTATRSSWRRWSCRTSCARRWRRSTTRPAGCCVLCAIEQVPYAEVAEAYGIAVGTVKSRVHRARAKLVDVLGDFLDDEPARATDHPVGAATASGIRWPAHSARSAQLIPAGRCADRPPANHGQPEPPLPRRCPSSATAHVLPRPHAPTPHAAPHHTRPPHPDPQESHRGPRRPARRPRGRRAGRRRPPAPCAPGQRPILRWPAASLATSSSSSCWTTGRSPACRPRAIDRLDARIDDALAALDDGPLAERNAAPAPAPLASR